MLFFTFPLYRVLTLSFILFYSIGYGQDSPKPISLDYKWDAYNDSLLTDEIKEKELAELKSVFITEFHFNNLGQLEEYRIIHHIYWLNSDDAIEQFNKVYLPFNQSTKVIESMARVIDSKKKVTELNQSKIMTATDDETGNEYKYFAFEGIEKGSIVEYYTILLKKQPSYSGRKVTLQSSHDKYNIEFHLYTPSSLEFVTKSYNGLDSVQTDTIIEDRNHWFIKTPYIEKLEDEDYAAYEANKQFLIYKLEYNANTGKGNLISYANTTKGIYGYFYNAADKKDIKKIKKLIETSGANAESTTIDKIRTIENYIKKNFYIIENSSKEQSEIAYLLNKKVGSLSGIVKLYIEAYSQMGLNPQIVLTCDRFNLKFDPEFEADNFLQDFLLYFPSIEESLSPDNIGSRIGFPEVTLTDNHGLFIKKIKLGTMESGLGEIKYIKGTPYEKSFDNLLIEVTFDNDDITLTHLNINKSTGGYYAENLQAYIHLIQDKDKAIEEQITYINENLEIISKTVENDDPKYFGKAPLVIDAQAKSSDFVNKAGNTYLFKVGELIGPQSEMYQEKKRVQPMEFYFRKKYHRVITVNIPKGYKIANLKDINIKESFSKNGKELMKFESSYTMEGNQLIITADEFYDAIRLPASDFNDYRRVINAAADFNKITLILEKK